VGEGSNAQRKPGSSIVIVCHTVQLGGGKLIGEQVLKSPKAAQGNALLEQPKKAVYNGFNGNIQDL